MTSLTLVLAVLVAAFDHEEYEKLVARGRAMAEHGIDPFSKSKHPIKVEKVDVEKLLPEKMRFGSKEYEGASSERLMQMLEKDQERNAQWKAHVKDAQRSEKALDAKFKRDVAAEISTVNKFEAETHAARPAPEEELEDVDKAVANERSAPPTTPLKDIEKLLVEAKQEGKAMAAGAAQHIKDLDNEVVTAAKAKVEKIEAAAKLAEQEAQVGTPSSFLEKPLHGHAKGQIAALQAKIDGIMKETEAELKKPLAKAPDVKGWEDPVENQLRAAATMQH